MNLWKNADRSTVAKQPKLDNNHFEQTENSPSHSDLDASNDSSDEDELDQLPMSCGKEQNYTTYNNSYSILKKTERDAKVPYDKARVDKIVDESLKLLYSNLEPILSNEKTSRFRSILAKSDRVRSIFEVGSSVVELDDIVTMIIRNFILHLND